MIKNSCDRIRQKSLHISRWGFLQLLFQSRTSILVINLLNLLIKISYEVLCMLHNLKYMHVVMWACHMHVGCLLIYDKIPDYHSGIILIFEKKKYNNLSFVASYKMCNTNNTYFNCMPSEAS